MKTLTGDDIAMAQNAVGLALSWWAKRRGSSGFKTQQVGRLRRLNARLNKISDYAYPYKSADVMPIDCGREVIMRVDEKNVKRTRAAARKANKNV
jgi:hypothetical protein